MIAPDRTPVRDGIFCEFYLLRQDLGRVGVVIYSASAMVVLILSAIGGSAFLYTLCRFIVTVDFGWNFLRDDDFCR